MIGFIMNVGLAIGAVVIVSRGVGVLIKSINCVFDKIDEGVESRLGKHGKQ